ncbi:pilus assembly protein [Mesorhizobium sp. NBSH29]|uniref:TadE/TadG family type IV pilus assembly protein n=1 Tax=Mesorhizobium sp. NBSH29 TaxID=2654249 RepID=UPI0018965774|nr:TadE/TadG family type IV pilus assembly protein [Mesorhizobium sp. NBSH29]QPC86546.1 pilus assembly protein [Mesorhizobium sp. NBSH29]
MHLQPGKMNRFNVAGAMFRSISTFIGKIKSDHRGVAAIEFAMVAPLLIGMCLVTWELALGVDTSRKVGRAGSTIGDLVAQENTMKKSELQGILTIGRSIIQPYNRSDPAVTITAITVSNDAAAKPTVAWAYKVSGSNSYSPGAAVGSPETLPEKLRTPGAFLIRVESNLSYKPAITFSSTTNDRAGLGGSRPSYEMKETYFMRPRISVNILCTDCYS